MEKARRLWFGSRLSSPPLLVVVVVVDDDDDDLEVAMVWYQAGSLLQEEPPLSFIRKRVAMAFVFHCVNHFSVLFESLALCFLNKPKL